MREEGTGMDLLVDGCTLGKDSTYSHAGCIYFYDKLVVWIRDLEDRSCGKM